MRVQTSTARRIAKVCSEDVIEDVEKALGIMIDEEKWVIAADAITEDLAESIVDVFEAL